MRRKDLEKNFRLKGVSPNNLVQQSLTMSHLTSQLTFSHCTLIIVEPCVTFRAAPADHWTIDHR